MYFLRISQKKERVEDWKPDEDRNELWTVLESLDFKARARAFSWYKEDSRPQCPNVGDIYGLCMKVPRMALEAICESHRGYSGS